MKTILETFLEELNIKHTHRFAARLYNEHPNKNNMLGLKQMLQRYGVEAVGVRLDEKKLEELVFPCILHIKGDFVIGRSLRNGVLEYLWNGKVTREPVQDFLPRWSGNALLPVHSPAAAEPDYKANVRAELTDKAGFLFLVLLPLAFLVYGCVHNRLWEDITAMSLLAVNVTGAGVSMLLVQKQLFRENRVTDRICSLFHRQDCNNVLFSEKAKLWDTFSWSEVGVGYFLVLSLTLALMPSCLPAVTAIAWAAMPYGIWSVWYQQRVVGQWCMLCMIVQGLIWTGGIIAGLHYAIGSGAGIMFGSAMWLRDFISVGLLVVLAIIVLHFITSAISLREELTAARQKYNAIKANETVFGALLQESEEFPATAEDSTIVMGAKDAKYRVTVLSNPHCNPCARMHERICRVLNACAESVSVQYILSAFNDDLLQSNRFLIAAFQQRDYATAMHILELWYKEGKYDREAFILKWELDLHTPEVEAEMERHSKWRERTKLTATPTIIVNNRLLPMDTYQIEDIINL